MYILLNTQWKSVITTFKGPEKFVVIMTLIIISDGFRIVLKIYLIHKFKSITKEHF